MVNLVTSEEDKSIVGPLAERLCGKFPRIKTIVNNINGRKASIAVGEEEKVLSGDGFINDKIGPFTFRGFGQFVLSNQHLLRPEIVSSGAAVCRSKGDGKGA